MPVYRTKCSICDTESDIFRRVAEYNDLPICCGAQVSRKICAPMVTVDVPEYRSMATGEMIRGRAMHREHLRKHDLVEIGNEKLGPKKYEADHNVRPELMEAVKQHGLGR